MRSTDLVYSDQQATADPLNPIYTFLVYATQTGYTRSRTGYLSRSLPPLEFDYSQAEIQSASPDSIATAWRICPRASMAARYQWVDLDGEGLSGILAGAGGGWVYKPNFSAGQLVARPMERLDLRRASVR